MKAWRCKCGHRTGFGSMGPWPCQTCEKCGSTMASHPDHHQGPEPHDYKTRYHQKTGKPFKVCSRCMDMVGYVDAGQVRTTTKGVE